MATVLERLHARLGDAEEAVYDRALRTLAAALPVDRRVELTDEIVRAAANGDVALLVILLAPEVLPDPQDLAALEALEREPDRRLVSVEEARRELGL
jgi:hypothetical protein